MSKKLLAKQMAENIQKIKGYSSIDDREEKKEDHVQKTNVYDVELEINDFPQNVRFKITCKDTLDHLMDYGDCYASVKGAYVHPKKNILDNERKLYLHIQAQSEHSIQKTKTELIRIIKEELVRLQHTYAPTNEKGRYKVL